MRMYVYTAVSLDVCVLCAVSGVENQIWTSRRLCGFLVGQLLWWLGLLTPWLTALNSSVHNFAC